MSPDIIRRMCEILNREGYAPAADFPHKLAAFLDTEVADSRIVNLTTLYTKGSERPYVEVIGNHATRMVFALRFIHGNLRTRWYQIGTDEPADAAYYLIEHVNAYVDASQYADYLESRGKPRWRAEQLAMVIQRYPRAFKVSLPTSVQGRLRKRYTLDVREVVWLNDSACPEMTGGYGGPCNNGSDRYDVKALLT